MKCNKICSLFLSVLMIIFSVPAGAFAEVLEDDFTNTVLSNETAEISEYTETDTDIVIPDTVDGTLEDDFTYTVLSNGTAEISGYTGTDTDIVIPDAVDGYTVTSIGKRVFQYKSKITSVFIPSAVTNIAEYAFSYCSGMERLEGAENVLTIGSSAFYACHSLSDIPSFDKVQSIGAKSFYGTKISVRAYLKIWDHVYYSQAVTRSANDVARAVINDDDMDESIKLQVKEIFNM